MKKATATLVFTLLAASLALLASLHPAWAGGSRAPSRLAYVGVDNNIYYCKGDCLKPECATCQAGGVQVRNNGLLDASYGLAGEQRAGNYNWPTYSPDGSRIAYISTSRGENGILFAVLVFDFKTHTSARIFESSKEEPIYLFWLSDSQRLSFLTASPNGLTLMLASIEQGEPVRIVTRGQPLYFDWNPALHKLVVHTGTADAERTERVYLMKLTRSGQEIDKVLSMGYAPFKAPAWSPDGKRLAYVSNTGGRLELSVGDAAGLHPRAMAALPRGETSFVWAPDSRRIAYSSAPPAETIVYEGIAILDTDSGKVKKIVNGPLAAYYFSPDSRYLAYIGAPSGSPFYSWNVVDLRSGKSRHLVDFITTRDEAVAYRYFDQLALSHSTWSPASDAVIFAGVAIRNEPPMSPHFSPPPAVWILPIKKTAQPRRIADGTLAFWSPVAGE